MAEESSNPNFDWVQYSRKTAGDFLNRGRESELDHKILSDDSVVKIMSPVKKARCYRLELLHPNRRMQHIYPVKNFDQAWNTYCAVESAKDFEMMVDELDEYDDINPRQILEK